MARSIPRTRDSRPCARSRPGSGGLLSRPRPRNETLPSLPPARLLLALTSHGLGHLTRSLEIARALWALAPDTELVVASRAPRERIAEGLGGAPFTLREVDYEPGTLQRSCFEIDVPGTRAAYARYGDERARRLDEERRFLREGGCTAVVSDIPALPLRAAHDLGLPGIGIGNFTWDWILEPLLEGSAAAPVVTQLRDDYAHGTLHLRLPLGPESSPFPRAEPAPLVSRRAARTPAEVRRRLGLPEADGLRLAGVCPGGWSPEGWSPVHVAGCAGYRFVTVGDLPISAEAPLLPLPHALAPGITFPDLVAAADVVVAKPGYGIASECLAHATPLVAIERPGFRETPVLLEDCRRAAPTPELSLRDFFDGAWEPALRRAARGASGRAAPPPADAAARIARRLAAALGLSVPPARGDASTGTDAHG